MLGEKMNNRYNNMGYGYRKPSFRGSMALGIVVTLVVFIVVLVLLQIFLGVDIVQGIQDIFDSVIGMLTGFIKAPIL